MIKFINDCHTGRQRSFSNFSATFFEVSVDTWKKVVLIIMPVKHSSNTYLKGKCSTKPPSHPLSKAQKARMFFVSHFFDALKYTSVRLVTLKRASCHYG